MLELVEVGAGFGVGLGLGPTVGTTELVVVGVGVGVGVGLGTTVVTMELFAVGVGVGLGPAVGLLVCFRVGACVTGLAVVGLFVLSWAWYISAAAAATEQFPSMAHEP